ncbi:MAG: phosphatase PAP2 family protein [Planctomycetota bacterium]
MSSGPAAAELTRHVGATPRLPESIAGIPARTWLQVLVLISVGLAFIPIDRSLILWIGEDCLPGEMEVLLNRIEPFGHAYGVLFIVATLWVVAGLNLRQVGLLFGCSFGAGIAADVVKLFVARFRPADLPADAASTFLGIRPIWDLGAYGDLFDSAHHSFPSAHTATAFGLAVALGHVFPRGRSWFLFLAALVAFQRIAFGYHYPSDTFIGAAVGILSAATVLRLMRRQRQTDALGASAA